MRNVDRIAIAELIPKIESGELSVIEANAFFILVRGSAADFPIIRDIGDSVAHDARDRGLVHKHLNTIVDEFLTAVRDHGGIYSRTLYPIDELIPELEQLLDELGFDFDIEAAERHQQQLVMTIGEMLDGTQIALRAREFKADLSMTGGQPLLRLVALEDVGPIRQGQGIAMPMLRRMSS